MYLDLFRAIEDRHLIQMCYGSYYRVIEPHVYGADSRGVDVLRAYQVAGLDGSKRDIGWKWFNTRHITNVVVLAAHFQQERTGVPVPPGAIRRIYCQVTA